MSCSVVHYNVISCIIAHAFSCFSERSKWLGFVDAYLEANRCLCFVNKGPWLPSKYLGYEVSALLVGHRIFSRCAGKASTAFLSFFGTYFVVSKWFLCVVSGVSVDAYRVKYLLQATLWLL